MCGFTSYRAPEPRRNRRWRIRRLVGFVSGLPEIKPSHMVRQAPRLWRPCRMRPGWSQCSSASEAAYLLVDRFCCRACPAFWLHPAPWNFADPLMCSNRRCPSQQDHSCSLDIPILPRRNSVRSGSKHSGCCSSVPAQGAPPQPARTQSCLQSSSLRQPHLVTPIWRTSLCRRRSHHRRI